MEQTWRWFGPKDPISLTKVRQAGATGIVTALHEVPTGQVWTRDAIAERKLLIERAGLTWQVVESLPVAEAIRLKEHDRERLLDAYIQSLRNLGEEGVKVVCYNFMPAIDWTRTNLDWRCESGARTLRFDATQWAAFDLFLLGRPGAERDYSVEQVEAARASFEALSPDERERLIQNVAAGLPGSNVRAHSLEGLREVVARWSTVGETELFESLVDFLQAVVPVCEEYDIRLCLHPDDPPRKLLGLPHVASCAADFEALFERVPSPASGMTLCVGSLGAGTHNDPARIASKLAQRIYFAHLRAVRLEKDGSFVEAEHLEGDANLVEVVAILVAEERRRRGAGEAQTDIPMRPDHGQMLEGDIEELPGYSWLGRLKALAELRGVVRAVEQLT